MTDVPLAEAHERFHSLVQRAATERERTTITDHGEPAAVLVNAEELADLEEAVAIQEYLAQKAAGTLRRIPRAQAMARLGLSSPPK